MDTAAERPVEPASESRLLRVGEHVHQLLNLVHALSTPTRDSAAAPPAQVGVKAGSLTDKQCIQWAQDIEQLLRWGQALSVQVAGEVGQRVSAGRYAETGARGAVGLMSQALRISPAEAKRRLALAEVVTPTMDGLTGDVSPVAQPVLAQAFFAGAVSAEQALTVAGFVDEAGRLAENGRISQQCRFDVEDSLVSTARVQSPDFVRQVGNRIMSHLDPDGHKPSHSDLVAKQGLFFKRARRGLVGFSGHMTVEQYEQLIAAIGNATNPNKHSDIDSIPGTEPDADIAGGQGPVEAPLFDQLGNLATFLPATRPKNPPTLAKNPPTRPETRPATRSETPLENRPPNQSATAPVADGGLSPRPLESEAEKSNGVACGPAATSRHNQTHRKEANTQTQGWEGSQWWGRRLEDWEIPPRPPGAPAYATPPVFEGEDWFWLPEQGAPPPRPDGAGPNGAGPNGAGFNRAGFNGAGSKGSPSHTVASNPANDNPFDLGGNPSRIDWNNYSVATRLTEIEAENDPNSSSVGGVGSCSAPQANSVDSGQAAIENPSGDPFSFGIHKPSDPFPSGKQDRHDVPHGKDPSKEQGEMVPDDDADDERSWPRIIDGVEIPAPGSGGVPEGLEPIDPLSTDPAVKDTRTHGQQLLDGLISCVKLAARTGKLPLNGGLKTQLILTCSLTDLEREDGLGTVYTTRSGPMPRSIFDQSLCDPEVTEMLYRQGQTVLNAGRSQRLFTPDQRKLLVARDLGCCFPDCTMPPQWTEAHHVVPWQEGGESNLSNAALLCEWHHHLIHHSDWTVTLIDGTPSFTPPWIIDPMQRPRRNAYHHGLLQRPN